jgi:hypothetical protein
MCIICPIFVGGINMDYSSVIFPLPPPVMFMYPIDSSTSDDICYPIPLIFWIFIGAVTLFSVWVLGWIVIDLIKMKNKRK